MPGIIAIIISIVFATFIVVKKIKSIIPDEKLKELEAKKENDNRIIKENEDAYSAGKKPPHSDEQMERAMEKSSSKEINAFYKDVVNPAISGGFYILYLLMTFVLLPFTRYSNSLCLAVGGYLFFIAGIVLAILLEKLLRKWFNDNKKIFDCLSTFANDTAVFNFGLSALGYVLSKADSLTFWLIYFAMLLIIAIAALFDILIPYMRKSDEE